MENETQLLLEKNYLYRGSRYLARSVCESLRDIRWDYIQQDFSSFKNKHKGKACFVIGNGPSLNLMDLTSLKSEITIACNSFYLLHSKLGFVPTYYTVEDPLPAYDNQKEISSLRDSVKFIPCDLKKIITPDPNTFYVNFHRSYMRSSNPKFPLFSYDFAKKAYWGGTVLFYNLQLAYYLGCNPIYLIGVDLAYEIPKDIKRYGGILVSQSDDPNHFDKRYFGSGKAWHVPHVSRMQQAFTNAYFALKEKNILLFNATVGGNLTVVPRRKFEQSLSEKVFT